jgi:Mn-dependent DtxR family transcriptional regulator
MAKDQLSSRELDSKVYTVVQEANEGVKGREIYGRLQATNAVHPSDVARSIWRLHDRGEVTVSAGRGVELANNGRRIR